MAGARDPRTTLENPQVTSDSGRGAEASANLVVLKTPKTGQTKMAVVLSPWEQRVDALQQGGGARPN